jgi:hypothetical protein
MNEYDILQELLALLESNGVAVRREPLAGSGGGLCALKGKDIFFVDSRATSGVNAVNAAQAVNKMIDTESLYVRPQVRQYIKNFKNIEE